MSEVQAPVTTERVITIYATRGGQMKKITTDAQTWGDLQPLVRKEGFDLSSLLAAESVNKSDLVNDLAVLPAQDFRLFLRPKQTKSGATPDRKECFAIIKEHIANNPADKPKFTIDGKNMTQLSTPVVQELVAKYCGKSKKAAKASTKAEEVGTQEAPIKEKKDVAEIAEDSLAGIVTKAICFIAGLTKFPSFEKANKHLNKLLGEVSEPAIAEKQAETEEEALRREAREMGY
jgi:hypothetical protein